MMYGWDPCHWAMLAQSTSATCWSYKNLGLSRSAAKTVLKRLHLHAISCLHNLLRREDTWNAMVDMQCKLEEEEEMWQASPSYSAPLLSGHASRQFNAERCSLFFSSLSKVCSLTRFDQVITAKPSCCRFSGATHKTAFDANPMQC